MRTLLMYERLVRGRNRGGNSKAREKCEKRKIRSDWRGDLEEERLAEKDLTSGCSTKEKQCCKKHEHLFNTQGEDTMMTAAERRLLKKKRTEENENRETAVKEKVKADKNQGEKKTLQKKRAVEIEAREKNVKQKIDTAKEKGERQTESGKRKREEEEIGGGRQQITDEEDTRHQVKKNRKKGRDIELTWSEEALGNFIRHTTGSGREENILVGGAQVAIETGGLEQPTVRPPEAK